MHFPQFTKEMIFFAKLLRSLEEKEETFQEEANASRQFIISCALTYHKLHFRFKICDYFLTVTRKEKKKSACLRGVLQTQ